MSKRWIAAAAVAGLALSGCARKETGPEDDGDKVAAPATASPVPAAVRNPDSAKALLRFAGMDSDGDGKVTTAEQAKASQTMFQAMDADKDGAVTVAEMDAARDAIGERPDLSSEKLIEQGDADHDGKLTLAEWVAASNARFARMDSNGDGVIDRAEWQAGLAAERAMATPAP